MFDLKPDTVAVPGFVSLLSLMLLRVPVGMAMRVAIYMATIFIIALYLPSRM